MATTSDIFIIRGRGPVIELEYSQEGFVRVYSRIIYIVRRESEEWMNFCR